MRWFRRRMLIAVGVVIVAPAVLPIAAQGQQQIKRAQKLLNKIKLVDGAGSGLDADTLGGMTPAQVTASVPPPTPDETLLALRQVDGVGSGLDADSLQGMTPEQVAQLPRPLVSVHRATRLTIPDGVASESAVTFDTEEFDTCDMYDPTDPSRFTACTTGIYLIFGSVRWVANDTGSRTVTIQRADSGTPDCLGSSLVAGESQTAVAGGVRTFQTISAVSFLIQGQGVQFCVSQDSGAPLDIEMALFERFGMVKIS
jgi:hypothetical protein